MAAVAIRGTTYPVVLPKANDPRLHLAATITSLQVLGQVAFGFQLSIAQILICLGTTAAIEVALTFRSKRVFMWPASALLTGNGVAFVLRVPGTVHGDWWSVRGWWIFAAVAAGSLLSKHLIAWRGEHFFNPSNIGLVVVFLALGRGRVDPLDFWWGPMSWWMALALAIIVAGGFAILRRLSLLRVALAFWAAFAASVGVLALSGHEMTARWHLGPLGGLHFWWLLVTSPEVLVFLFFMITDPKTAPTGGRARIVYGVTLGVLAGALIAPTTTEFAAKVVLLASLAVVCMVKPLLRFVPRRALVLAAAPALALAGGVLVFANGPSRSLAAPPLPAGALPPVRIDPSPGVQSQLDASTAELIAHELVAGVHAHAGDTIRVHLVPGTEQGPPSAVATLAGRTYRLEPVGARWQLLGGTPKPAAEPVRTTTQLAGLRLTNVAPRLGIDFRQGSFRFGASGEVQAMMGGGVCWLDYDGDGWMDLFAVNSYSNADTAQWEAHGGFPTSALYRNVRGSFVDVSAATHANLTTQGNGCAAADLDGDGRTDLVVSTTSGVVVLWNDGHGFTQQQLPATGWYTGVAIADVNGDDRPDVFVAGYADPSEPVPSSYAGFPTNLTGVRDLLFVNGGDRRFGEAGIAAGLESSAFSHGLGAEFVDANGDGRPDLYVANDEDVNELYIDVPWPGGAAADPAQLGFRFENRAAVAGVADPNAGMGIATRFTGRRVGLFVTNNRDQRSAAYEQSGTGFADARQLFDPALGTGFAGWGVSWVDLANSGTPDLVLAAGAIPVKSLSGSREPLRVLGPEAHGGYGDLPHALPGNDLRLNGRGLAPADVGNDGRMDVAVNTIGGKLVLLQPSGAGGHWIDVALSRLVPGAVVTATLSDGTSQTQSIAVGSSYLSSADPRVHFGLGAATTVRRLLVHYPWGDDSELANVAADRIVQVRVPALPKLRRPASAGSAVAGCTPEQGDVPRLWDAAAVAVLRIGGEPDPVQARDLDDLTVAMSRARTSAHSDAAVSYAAYRLLLWRASFAANLGTSFAMLEKQLRALCLSPDYTSTSDGTPAAAGNRIAARAIAAGERDGSNELLRYLDPSYTPQNAPLDLATPGTVVHDATFWQPLAVGKAGQAFAGSSWGRLGRAVDPGPAPFGLPSSGDYRSAVVGVIRATAGAPPAAGDPSPAGWNEIALRLHAGLPRLARLNRALERAAVSVYAAKRKYQAPRPVSMIRYLASQHALPLVPGLVKRDGGKTLVRERGRWVDALRWASPNATPASPGWPSEDAAFAFAARAVIGQSALATRLAQIGLANGIDTPADVAAGERIGRLSAS